MKNVILTAVTLLVLTSGAWAQGAKTAESKSTTRGSVADTIEAIYLDSASVHLYIPGSISKGSNGAGLAYNPVKKLYYAAFAGNSSFPLIVFKANGDVLADTCITGIDLRGIWYNSKTGMLEGNGYSTEGIVQYKTDKKGVPVSYVVVLEDLEQPDDNSTAAFDAVNNELLYLDPDFGLEDVEIVRYNKTTGQRLGSLTLYVDAETIDYLNTSTVVYTGIKGAELGILDYDLAIIHLFDMATGDETKTVYLPYDALTQDRFNFSYANGMFWLFDTEYRVWDGFKMK